MLEMFAAALSNLFQLYFIFIGLFYLFLGLCWFLPAVKRKTGGGKNKFAVLIPASNEEKVIKYSVESLIRQNYPKDRFRVFVIADNCSDNTAEIARGNGAEVLERRTSRGSPRTKGAALKWAVSIILSGKEKFDALCYFDADSLAHPDFLEKMNDALNSGEEVIQGRQLAKNGDGWLERILAAGHLVSNNFFQKPKFALGLSATLHGKGMVFSRSVAEKHEWDEKCLTEDLEMQMRLVKEGIRITWSEEAVLYDEEPGRIMQYLRRCVRWTRGSLDVARKHLNGLLKRFLLGGDAKALEAAVYSFNVYRVSMVFIAAAMTYYTRDGFNIIIWLYKAIPGSKALLKFANFIPLILYPAVVIAKENFSFRVISGYFMQPLLGIFRIPVFIMGIVQDKETWNKTEHESQVGIEEVAV